MMQQTCSSNAYLQGQLLSSGERGKLRLDLLPGCGTGAERLNCSDNVRVRSAHLSHGVTLPKGDCGILHAVKVHSDSKRRPELIKSRVPLSDRSARIVHSVDDAHGSQCFAHVCQHRVEHLVLGQRQHCGLDRSHKCREPQHNTSFVVALSHVKRVLKETVEQPADSKRRLDHRGVVISAAHLFYTLFKRDHLLLHVERAPVLQHYLG
mmetsp:Transcript_11374/g.34803  ORF Transcript_11374/g.34803 Transcript_11374/m.34803 type:complete len:208 (-) Transcript_11374:1593-2216(-)